MEVRHIVFSKSSEAFHVLYHHEFMEKVSMSGKVVY